MCVHRLDIGITLFLLFKENSPNFMYFAKIRFLRNFLFTVYPYFNFHEIRSILIRYYILL